MQPAITIAYEFTPTSALKEAVEQGVTLSRADSGAIIAVRARWAVYREGHTLEYILAPQSPLLAGAYYLTLPRAAWVEFAKAYSARYTNLMPIRAAEFPELENGDLRAEFRVGP